MNSFKNVFIFATGAAIGSLVTWKIVKTKYEQLAQEEIESVKERFTVPKVAKEETGEESEEEEQEEKQPIPNEKPSLKEYAAVLKESGYVKGDESMKEETCSAYIITPEEFGEFEEYEAITIMYYADGTLVNEFDEVLDDQDIDTLIGRDSLTHFGEYEEDSVFVRNDEYKADYEILMDLRTYEEMLKDSSQSMEG